MAQYNKEQYEKAQRNNNALDYAKKQGYELVRKGSYYCMKEHDSLVFTAQGSFFWNSRQLHGRALEFIMAYEGKSFAEAVLILAGEENAPSSSRGAHTHAADPPPLAPPEPVAFKLPPRASSPRQLFGYLCRSRHLDYRLVKEMLAQEILYESIYRTKSGLELHNACFVSYNSSGQPCSAFQRGLGDHSTYKGEVPGGDKRWGWLLAGRAPHTLLVFEAAIDAASYATILIRQGKDPLTGNAYLALGGLTFEPVQRYLDRNPHIREVHLMLDADTWGRSAALRFQVELQEMGYTVPIYTPPVGKDWNDTLRAMSVPKNTKT